jgi:hypothetical protein
VTSFAGNAIAGRLLVPLPPGVQLPVDIADERLDTPAPAKQQ